MYLLSTLTLAAIIYYVLYILFHVCIFDEPYYTTLCHYKILLIAILGFQYKEGCVYDYRSHGQHAKVIF